MSKVLIEEQTLHDIGDAIREKNGLPTTYKPAEMIGAISVLSGGGMREPSDVSVDVFPDPMTVLFSRRTTIVSQSKHDNAVDLTLSINAGSEYPRLSLLMNRLDESFDFGKPFLLSFNLKFNYVEGSRDLPYWDHGYTVFATDFADDSSDHLSSHNNTPAGGYDKHGNTNNFRADYNWHHYELIFQWPSEKNAGLFFEFAGLNEHLVTAEITNLEVFKL